jgi:pyridoxamine 5'-phosphate oxidase
MVTARLDTLDAVEAAVWSQLAQAVGDRSHGWRTPVLATADADGRPGARTVVMREVDVARRSLVIFTDARAAKVAQIAARPDGVLVHWSQPIGWQLRLAVRLDVSTDGLAVTSRWARVKTSPGAQDYLSPLAPGAPLGSEAAPSRHVDQREWFAVITAEVQSVDWLELHAEGHRRALFDAGGARWVQP